MSAFDPTTLFKSELDDLLQWLIKYLGENPSQWNLGCQLEEDRKGVIPLISATILDFTNPWALLFQFDDRLVQFTADGLSAEEVGSKRNPPKITVELLLKTDDPIRPRSLFRFPLKEHLCSELTHLICTILEYNRQRTPAGPESFLRLLKTSLEAAPKPCGPSA